VASCQQGCIVLACSLGVLVVCQVFLLLVPVAPVEASTGAVRMLTTRITSVCSGVRGSHDVITVCH
jgi:hypothetical protein